MSGFRIHPRLLEDAHRLGRLGGCHLLLHRNAAVPWFILVPEAEEESLLALPAPVRDAVMTDAAEIARFVTDGLGWPRINVAAIGNVVPQLHVHVIGRRPGDACWPAPVWGNLPRTPPYPSAQVAAIVQALAEGHGLAPDNTGTA